MSLWREIEIKVLNKSYSALFQCKLKKATTEQGDSAFFGNKIKHGRTHWFVLQTEEQTRVYKNLTLWRFWSESWEACFFKTVL